MSTDLKQVATVAGRHGIRMEQFGHGGPLLLLHGGGGPATCRAFAESAADSFTVLLPTHPGFDGTQRPSGIETVRDIANAYAAVLAEAGLTDIIVVGSSMGGWIAAELAISFPRLLSGMILLDPVGIEVEGQEVMNVNAMPPAEIAGYSYHRPERFRVDPSALSADMRAAMQANFATLAHYAADHYMQDPALAGRLGGVDVPTLVLWGESDRIVRPAYGRAFADAIPGATFRIIAECGHLPQIEQPAMVRKALVQFAAGLSDVSLPVC